MAERIDPILVTVVGGYLGAGKTSLVNHILRSSDDRIAVIVNDFGSIAIDEDLIAASDDDKITLANGCICCSLIDGFATALDAVRSGQHPPDRLLIEASGVADPAQIAAYGHLPGLALDGVVTVADAELVRAKAGDEYVGDVVAAQLSAADVIVLNKTDMVAAPEVAATKSWLGVTAPGVLVVEAQRGQAQLAVLLGPAPTPRTELVRLPEAQDLFESSSYVADDPVDRATFEAAFAAAPEAVFRIKGVVRFVDDPEERIVFERVGKRQSFVPHGMWRGGPSRIVLIGLRGAVHGELGAVRGPTGVGEWRRVRT